MKLHNLQGEFLTKGDILEAKQALIHKHALYYSEIPMHETLPYLKVLQPAVESIKMLKNRISRLSSNSVRHDEFEDEDLGDPDPFEIPKINIIDEVPEQPEERKHFSSHIEPGTEKAGSFRKISHAKIDTKTPKTDKIQVHF